MPQQPRACPAPVLHFPECHLAGLTQDEASGGPSVCPHHLSPPPLLKLVRDFRLVFFCPSPLPAPPHLPPHCLTVVQDSDGRPPQSQSERPGVRCAVTGDRNRVQLAHERGDGRSAGALPAAQTGRHTQEAAQHPAPGMGQIQDLLPGQISTGLVGAGTASDAQACTLHNDGHKFCVALVPSPLQSFWKRRCSCSLKQRPGPPLQACHPAAP